MSTNQTTQKEMGTSEGESTEPDQKAMQTLEGECTEPKVLDQRIRDAINCGLCEYPVAMMLTDVGEVSKEKRRGLKRSTANSYPAPTASFISCLV